jgi:hypothetical protein
VGNSTIVGNYYYTKEDILSLAGIKDNQSLYTLSKKKIKNNLSNSIFIQDVQVELSPFGLVISYQEDAPCFAYNQEIYLSSGKKLTSEEINDENNQKYLSSHLNDQIILLNEPLNSSFPLQQYCHLGNLILSLNKEDSSLIKYASYDEETYYYSLYYFADENTLLKLSFDSTLQISEIKPMLTSHQIAYYLSSLDDELFIPQEITLSNHTYQVYGIKVILRYTNNEPYYYVKIDN